MLRWQNDEGTRLSEKYGFVQVGESSAVRYNDGEFCDWLVRGPARVGAAPHDQMRRRAAIERAEEEIGERLASGADSGVHPEPFELVHAAWCGEEQEPAGAT